MVPGHAARQVDPHEPSSEARLVEGWAQRLRPYPPSSVKRVRNPRRETPVRGRLRDLMEDYERRVIADALARHEGRVIDVMAELDLPRRTLNEKMSRLGLSRP